MSVKFTSNAPQFPEEVSKTIRKALETIGGQAENYAKINLTRNKSVQTGTLRGSVTHKPADDTTMAVGTNVEYAPYVELGHHQQPGRYVPKLGKRLKKSWVAPKPYLRPAVENHIEEYTRIIKKELSDIGK